MKIQHIIALLLLTGSVAARAQTTNASTSTNALSLLTKDQAINIALQLADKKVEEERKGHTLNPHYPVFERNLNLTNNMMFQTHVNARFVDGYWKIDLGAMDTHDCHHATIELAADGSTNSAIYRREGGLP